MAIEVIRPDNSSKITPKELLNVVEHCGLGESVYLRIDADRIAFNDELREKWRLAQENLDRIEELLVEVKKHSQMAESFNDYCKEREKEKPKPPDKMGYELFDGLGVKKN